MSRTWERLRALGLLEGLQARSPQELEVLASAEGPPALLRCAEAGVLTGALSVALDVRPDELFGPLAQRMGGAARTLRILDVRDRPEYQLTVQTPAGEERWATPTARSLVHNLNDLFRADAGVARVAVLGEWNDALQLWCLEARRVGRLRREPFFAPENLGELLGEEA